MNNAAPVPITSEMRNVLKTTRGLLATDLVILNHGQGPKTTPELPSPSPFFHTTPTCDGSIRDFIINPLGKSLGDQFALFTTNPSEEENRDM
ncbi:hypothetical protein TNCV_1587901 [Trichonephila clavipes]|uniref:Uncharacterized protein n=1 Tax=Trichonephila clavipes TaxID=2585209 RepID=A0A8X6UZH8_TRICX|nr:hypothetical protein TNCV_1587901 [Trichonephila clavipes]